MSGRLVLAFDAADPVQVAALWTAIAEVGILYEIPEANGWAVRGRDAFAEMRVERETRTRHLVPVPFLAPALAPVEDPAPAPTRERALSPAPALNGSSPLQCLRCDRSFPTLHGLRIHWARGHKGEVFRSVEAPQPKTLGPTRPQDIRPEESAPGGWLHDTRPPAPDVEQHCGWPCGCGRLFPSLTDLRRHKNVCEDA